MTAKVGAPPGGRVHWLIWNLPSEIKRAYEIIFDYEFHNYLLQRKPDGKHKATDFFIVVRTSRRCWRCYYFHFEYKYFEYFSEKTSNKMAEHILKVYHKIRASEERAKLEQKERDS